METILLTCLQAQLLSGRINKTNISPQIKLDLIEEVRLKSPKECQTNPLK